ncbi:transposase [Spartinivicinus poritis]|uniref:Transposase n=1 Tax=Spartinivicinus poritis TaxID=2994640 RepID=A0ABT5UHL9_9GAMM|nr:transposase [Spartinivicinus sp. A2-2]
MSKRTPQMTEEQLKKLLGNITTQDQFNELTQSLLKTFVESALNAEMDEHLGYEKHAVEGHNSGNSRC